MIIGLVPVALVVGLVLFPAATEAQVQGYTVTLAGLTTEGSAEAQAVVTVLDIEGATAADLAAGDFHVEINGSPVEISELSRGVDSSLPLSVVLALDTSGSMEGGPLDQAKAAAVSFLNDLESQDSVAVLTFNDMVDLVVPFTQDKAAVSAAVESLTAGGSTALYQATSESARVAADGGRYSAVILLSDGLDHGSLLTRGDALAAAETFGVPVFSIGLGQDIDRAYLQEVARLSGGQSAETTSPEGLAQLYRDAGELLRGQYILTLDTSDLTLLPSEPATLNVAVQSGGLEGSAERVVCPQHLCVALSQVVADEELDALRTIGAQVISAELIASVSFLVDGAVVVALDEPPYEFAFEPAAFEDGEHAISVRVVTVDGQSEASEVTVHTGGGGGGMSSALLVGGVLILGAALVTAPLLLLRRRRSGGEERELDPENLKLPVKTRRPLPDEPGLPTDRVDPEPGMAEIDAGYLHVTGGSLAGHTFPVGSAPVSMGAGQACFIQLSYDDGQGQIPAEYARVWIRDGMLMVHEVRRLTELGPEGGRWQKLGPGDEFTIGACTFRFTFEEAPQEAPSVLREQPGPKAEEQPAPTEGAQEPFATPPSSSSEGDEPPGPPPPLSMPLPPQA